MALLVRILYAVATSVCLYFVFGALHYVVRGVQIADPPYVLGALAVSYYLFDQCMEASVKRIPFERLQLLLQAVTKSEAANGSYALSVLGFIARRLLTGIAFLIIASALAPRALGLESFKGALLAGVTLAFANWFSPVPVCIILLLLALMIGLPIMSVFLIVDRMAGISQKGAEPVKRTGLAYYLGLITGYVGAIPIMAFIKLLDMIPPAPLPPRTVPEGLTAKRYYELGERYKEIGWASQSKLALKRAIDLDGEAGEFGRQARAYLDTKLPRCEIPDKALQLNIQGFNDVMSGNSKSAKKIFEELISEYPDFEWPYGNLASIYIREKNVARSKDLLHRALEINPTYLNAWLHMVDLAELENNDEEAQQALEMCRKLAPDDPQVKLKASKHKDRESEAESEDESVKPASEPEAENTDESSPPT